MVVLGAPRVPLIGLQFSRFSICCGRPMIGNALPAAYRPFGRVQWQRHSILTINPLRTQRIVPRGRDVSHLEQDNRGAI